MPSILPTQAYTLKLAPHPAPFSVLRFSGRDAVSELYRYDIEFTSPVAGLSMEQVVGRPAHFTIAPVDPNMVHLRRMFGEDAEQLSKMPAAYTVHGVITAFDELATSADETHYRVRLEPVLADLDRGVTSRLFQKQSVQEIVTVTLRHHGYRVGVDFMFKLRHAYPRHEYVTQYHETTVAFIQRMCAQEGIWFRWEQKRDHAVMVFGDDLDAYARKQRTVPYRRDSGMESAGADAIKTLEKRTRRVPEAVKLHDYNHRQANVSLLVEQNAARGAKSTHGVDYRWGEHYATPEEGERVARLRHEAYLAGQICFRGTGNPFCLEAGEVMRVDPVQADAKHGIFVTAVEAGGGRSQAYWLDFEGIPSDRIWRTPLASIARPSIDGILPARITSPKRYQYAYMTEQGWYVIRLPFDIDDWSPGGESRPVRLARPYSGKYYGHHFPLIDGAEVAVAFTGGNPDRPVIIGAMHDSQHPDLVTSRNHTRNIVRTAGGNELRMEDREGAEHVHLSTPYRTSELNLGHMVDAGGKARGRGAELRSDGPAAIRGNGVFVSAAIQTGAKGAQLEMADAIAQLESALQIAKTLRTSVEAAQADAADTATQQQTTVELKALAQPGMLLSAPASIGLVSSSSVQIAARNNVSAVAGRHLDISVVRRFGVAAGDAISLFAQKLGIKLFAGRGPVDIQAQSDAMTLLAEKDLVASSVNGKVRIHGQREIVLESGGAFIRIADGNVTVGGPGDLILKTITLQKQGASSLAEASKTLPKPGGLYDEQFTLRDEHTGEVLAHTAYQMQAPGGPVEGISDALGQTVRVFSDKAQALKIFKGEGHD